MRPDYCECDIQHKDVCSICQHPPSGATAFYKDDECVCSDCMALMVVDAQSGVDNDLQGEDV